MFSILREPFHMIFCRSDKPQASGDDHNVIKLLRRQDLSQEAAYEAAGQAVRDRYRKWYLALAEVPMWGECIDVQVQKYIRGCQDIVLANLNWR